MTKHLAAVIAVFTFAIGCFAQDYNKAELFAGYSNGQVDESNSRFVQSGTFDTGPGNFHGFNVAGVYNFSRYIGVKADVSGTYDRGSFHIGGTGTSSVTGNARTALYNVLGGVQFKDNAVDRRVKPFGHVLVGAGIAKNDLTFNCSGSGCPGGIIIPDDSQTGFATVIGAGIDIKLNNHLDLRAIQIDYNPIRFNDSIDHNARISVGIVIK